MFRSLLCRLATSTTAMAGRISVPRRASSLAAGRFRDLGWVRPKTGHVLTFIGTASASFSILSYFLITTRVIEVECSFRKEQLSRRIANPEALTRQTREEQESISYMGESARHKWRELVTKREKEYDFDLVKVFYEAWRALTEEPEVRSIPDSCPPSEQGKARYPEEESARWALVVKKEKEVVACLSVLSQQLGKKPMKQKKEKEPMANTSLARRQVEKKEEELVNRFQKWLLEGEVLKWFLSDQVRGWSIRLSEREIEAVVNDGLRIVEKKAWIKLSELKRKELVSYGCEFLNDVALFQLLPNSWLDSIANRLMEAVSQLPKEAFGVLIENQLDRWQEVIERPDDDQTVATS